MKWHDFKNKLRNSRGYSKVLIFRVDNPDKVEPHRTHAHLVAIYVEVLTLNDSMTGEVQTGPPFFLFPLHTPKKFSSTDNLRNKSSLFVLNRHRPWPGSLRRKPDGPATVNGKPLIRK